MHRGRSRGGHSAYAQKLNERLRQWQGDEDSTGFHQEAEHYAQQEFHSAQHSFHQPTPQQEQFSHYYEPPANNDCYDEPAEISMIIASGDVGKVIGARGSKIKEIEENSGCRVQFSREAEPCGGKRVTLSGPPDAVSRAEQAIRDIISDSARFNRNDMHSGGRPFRESDPSITKIIHIASAYCGRIIGAGGSRIRELQEETQASIKVDRNGTSDDQVPIVISGTQHQVLLAISKIEGITSRADRFNQQQQQSSRDEFCNTIFVPKGKIGKVIGAQGATIRWLQEETSTRIKIDSDRGDSDDACIEVKGTPDTVQNAIDKINEIVAETHSGGGGGGRMIVDSNANRDIDSTDHTIIKEFYKEHSEVSQMTDAEVKDFLKEQNNIILSDVSMAEGSICAQDILTPRDPHNRTLERKIPKPVKTFTHALFPWPDMLEEVMSKPGYVQPSPIQSMMWPCLLSGLDVIGVAQTGTGKTLAFLLPAFVHIEGQTKPRDRRRGPSAIILAPTRELAQQIHAEIGKFDYHGIRSICVYGGVEKMEQVAEYDEKRPEIVVGTPGRIFDMLDTKNIILDDTTYVVLDEADRMLDLGFEPQVLKILYHIGTTRQTVMTTATWPFSLQRVAYKFMIDPIQINVGSLDLSACQNVRQTFRFVQYGGFEAKQKLLLSIIKGDEIDDETGEPMFSAHAQSLDKAILFIGRKSDCAFLKEEISKIVEGQLKVGQIHGDLGQHDREASLEDFRSSETRILVATDIAARGLDITDVTHVINLDFPRNIEEYVHRIGRTARAGRKGLSITFLDGRDWNNAAELIQLLKDANQPVPRTLAEMATAFQQFKENKDDARSSGRGSNGGGGYGERFRGGGRGGRASYDWHGGWR